MTRKNKELIAEFMEAVYAMDKLDEIKTLIDKTREDSISKEDLNAILNKADEIDNIME